MGTRARGRLLAAVAVLAAAAGCGPGQPDPPVPAVPAFATTEARVVVTDDRTFPVNLLFLADEDDPIWTDVSAVVLSPDLEVSGFTVEAGDVTDRGRLGNLTLGVVPPATAVTATDVIVVLGDGTSRAYPIGAWGLAAAPEPAGRLLDVTEYVLAYPGTDHLEIVAENVSGDPVEVRSVDLGLTSLVVAEVTVDGQVLREGEGVSIPGGGQVSVVVRLTDDGGHDLYVTSPSVTVTGPDGQVRRQLFDPTLLGWTDLTDDRLSAFAQ